MPTVVDVERWLTVGLTVPTVVDADRVSVGLAVPAVVDIEIWLSGGLTVPAVVDE